MLELISDDFGGICPRRKRIRGKSKKDAYFVCSDELITPCCPDMWLAEILQSYVTS